ncbi:hypothetical protein WOLCODRAFT_138208 [Wolfiporia cocos MD-104 SS10]|uniref:Uncharacterized protein n=1 Tax=Wolfiporia cocos (strain MD-104) TaxID=742152 RepID=A0A2H3JLQ9_WOLCO|nr:hypothetical protein WOLCODRAFT_138208 [Wolfiporia cocos MD-104 SS10]
METTWDVYARLLLEKGYGHPLWYPEPHEKGEVNIGDVGFIWEGRFHCLLNASQPSDADVNRRWGDLGPFRFQPFHIDPTDQIDKQRSIYPRMLSSSGMKDKMTRGDLGEVGLLFDYPDEQAALLLVPSGVAYERRCCSRGIEDYISRNANEWYRILAKHVDLYFKRSDLVFVTGWIKTSDWLIAACTHGARNTSISADPIEARDGTTTGMSVRFLRQEGVASGWQYRASLQSRNEVRASGSDGDQSDSNRSDQCIFIQYHKIERRGILDSLLAMFKGSAPPHDPDDQSRGDERTDDSKVSRCDEGSLDSCAAENSASHRRIPSTSDNGPRNKMLDLFMSDSAAGITIATEDVDWLLCPTCHCRH